MAVRQWPPAGATRRRPEHEPGLTPTPDSFSRAGLDAQPLACFETADPISGSLGRRCALANRGPRFAGDAAGSSTRTVDNVIVKLRKKLEPIPDKPRHILTVYGVGYKLVP